MQGRCWKAAIDLHTVWSAYLQRSTDIRSKALYSSHSFWIDTTMYTSNLSIKLRHF